MGSNGGSNIILRKVLNSLSRHRLLPVGSRVLIAVSGGQDSLALSETLRELQSRDSRWSGLSLVHCDHCWPGDEGISSHVSSYASSASLRLHLVHALSRNEVVPVTERGGREWRYSAISEVAEKHGYTDVVTGHTKTDLAETVLFNLVQGTGPDGLASLTWSRKIDSGRNVRLVRPLLDVSRRETEMFCKERGIDVWHDDYNNHMKYARNVIRKSVFPILKDINPQVENALARTAHILREESNEMELKAQCSFGYFVVRNGNMVILNRTALKECEIATQRRILRMTLRRYTEISHTSSIFTQVENLRALLHARIGERSPSLPGGAQAHVLDEQSIVLMINGTAEQIDEQLVSHQQNDVSACHIESMDNVANTTFLKNYVHLAKG